MGTGPTGPAEGADPSPLASSVAALSAQMTRAVQLGDLATARALQTAIAGLLAAPAAPIVALPSGKRQAR